MKRLVIALALVLLLSLASAGALALSAPAPALADTGSISGTVTGGEFYWVSVGVYTIQDQFVAGGLPDAMLGTYTVTGIPPGTYKVQFSVGDQSLGTQYYLGKSTFKSADSVTVNSGQDTPHINATMLPAGTISGYVHASGSPLGGANVAVYNSDGEYAGNTTTSGADGSYAISGLSAGSYTVRFYDSGYDDQWYDNKDEATADPVPVGVGTETKEVNAVLVPTGVSLPIIDTVTSSTHPDPTKWYSNRNPSFSWLTTAFGQTIMGYSCTLDQSPTTVPGTSVSTTVANCGYTGKADGVWYFHVRAETSVGWGDAAHLKIQIDTTGPTTSAKAAKGRQGKAITLKCWTSDNLSPQVTGVTLIVTNAKHKVVKRFSLGTENVATWYSVKWTPKAKGTYSYAVRAKDLAGNAQAKAGSAKITVK